MRTVVVANQKGGVGKSTTVIHLSTYLVRQGKRVVVLDVDVQGNTSDVLSGSATVMGSVMACFKAGTFKPPGNDVNFAIYTADTDIVESFVPNDPEPAVVFRDTVNSLFDSGFDYCLVDTPPSLNSASSAPLYSADYVLSPIEMESFAFKGIRLMLNAINNAKQHNPDLRFLGMLPSKLSRTKPLQVDTLREVRAAYGQYVLPCAIYDRGAVSKALAQNITVWDLKKKTGADNEACAEMTTVMQQIVRAMEG